MKERVLQEVDIHSRLKHPAILDLHTFFEDENCVYLVLELAHNGTLLQYMNNKTLDELSAAVVLSQVVSGLQYLHSNFIMHRDLSMSNLLLTESLQVKISDFGLATEDQPLHGKHMTLCGTPNYISPEVAMHSPHGLETDVWGLGCLLYALLTGRPPFDTNAVKSTLTQVVMGGYTIPDHVSAEARHLIDRLLCKDPKKRILLNDVASHPFLMKNSQGDSGIMTISSSGRSIRSKSADQTNRSNRIFAGQTSTHHYSMYYPSHSVLKPASIIFQVPKRIEVPPLNTVRLQPTRHKTKSVILSIVEEPPGEVVIEFLKKNNSKKVQAVCRISSDGLRIILYKPNGGKCIDVRDDPPELPGTGADNHFSYESLPEDHWKKYLYAHRFVQMVRAKTPKVTFYSECAKCQLMENLEDFEMFLYNSGKVVKKDAGFQVEGNMTGRRIEAITEHAEKCYKHCIEIERRMSEMPQEFPCFPIIIGRRPAEHATPKQQPQGNTFNNYISASHTPVTKPNFYMPAYSFEKTPLTSQRIPPLGHYNPRVPETPLSFHHIAFAGVKNVENCSDGSAQIHYYDGSRMEALKGGNGINYWTPDGQAIKYNKDECDSQKLPHSVQVKFDALPNVLHDHLQRHQKCFTASTPKPNPMILLNMR